MRRRLKTHEPVTSETIPEDCKPLSRPSEMQRWIDHQVDVQLETLRRREKVNRELDTASLRKSAISLVIWPGINQFEVVDQIPAADLIVQYIERPGTE